MPDPKSEFDQELPGIGKACVVAVLGGISIGVLGAIFRLVLSRVESGHMAMIKWAHAWPWIGWILPILVGAVCVAIARWFIRRQPLASGSGVQHVEAIMRGEAEPASIWMIPVKFFGGLLAIGSGLALGREGPTIQMGATIGATLAKRFRCATRIMRELQAALGGAGLAVAFNAPVAGALFVFEEVTHSFRLRLTMVTLIASGTAICMSRLILGSAPDFQVVSPEAGSPLTLVFHLIFGLALGLLGILYNKITIFGLLTFERLNRWSPEVRAGLIGGLIGALAWFAPDFVGSGDAGTQRILAGGIPIMVLVTMVAVRWLIGPLSYSAGTPGGIFAPLLLLGAGMGVIFASGFNFILPINESLSPTAFALVGMTAFFTGVVRAPLTGMVLITEMTATTSLMIPMLVANFGALLSASLARGEPIYDTLRKRMMASLGKRDK